MILEYETHVFRFFLTYLLTIQLKLEREKIQRMHWYSYSKSISQRYFIKQKPFTSEE